ncbi:hypothetical protein CYLTODRAFT_490531 [Cylindrobasidium torrendii FP15055 ss-10]|uniref:Bromo domain-containing protein n=1 Tax=Cylindrobasidium torrendii FP15055 ss-10 TaxID=1314674 RepID=A0A0D7BBI7_9AGAR|nr:hypothetical protein CYLTODRAFT_490531 [Cylindrobasidium torrendii FP15055 ss-10]
MNNLLRTLTQTELSSDLRLLLQNVKDQRSGDKVEPFYEAIESVLAELRASTFDNHDADAFLRPVSKTDFPDYTTIITDPMDFGTMQKKARAKGYRSKAEFNADLEKIWRNCYMYNTTEGHHLHKCVERLKIKARRLLANITDRRERSDPTIPTPKRKGIDAPVFRLNLAPPQRTIRGLEGMPPRTGEGMAHFLQREAGIPEPLSPEPVDDAGERPRKRIKLEEGVEAVEDPDEWWNIMRTPDVLVNGVPPTFQPKRPRRRKARPPTSHGNGMLKLMNNNIRTIKRLRRTNAKFGALSEEVQDEPDIVEVDDPPEDVPWPTPPEVDERSGEQCLRWMGTKVLEHAGFQGTTKSTLDVLASVASDYLYNVGRTIKFLCDKHGSTMSPEEIILHTLFESGVTRIQDLERYVRDDVERYGVRLGELENKIVGAYREAASGGVTMDDEAMFEDDDEEDVGILALGDFADAVGVDYLGLRELGIAEELGLSNLTIPKKLLRRRRNNASAPVRTASPPPLYPPPPPLLPLTVDQIPDQIGLLQPLYKAKIQPSGIGFPMLMAPDGAPLQPPVPPGDAPLPDEVPAPAQMKMGPLGQIGATGAQSKKANDKKKEKEAKEKGKEKKERGKEVNGVNGTGEAEPPAKTKSKKKKKVTLDPQMEQMQGVIAPARG